MILNGPWRLFAIQLANRESSSAQANAEGIEPVHIEREEQV